MYDFKPADPQDPAAIWHDLVAAADALTTGEPDAVANMANVAALMGEFLPDLNWAGFYRVGQAKDGAGDELILGPFVGRPACIRIPFGTGVCGAAAQSRAVQCVADVHAFPGHIACDAASRSELVVPVLREGAVIALIDLDSPRLARFSADDVTGCAALAALLSDRI